MICDNCIHNAVCERAHFDNHCGYKHTEADIINPELEKIKAEIENMWIKSAKDLRTGEVIYENLCEHSEVLEIIDKHISELKGENSEI